MDHYTRFSWLKVAPALHASSAPWPLLSCREATWALLCTPTGTPLTSCAYQFRTRSPVHTSFTPYSQPVHTPFKTGGGQTLLAPELSTAQLAARRVWEATLRQLDLEREIARESLRGSVAHAKNGPVGGCAGKHAQAKTGVWKAALRQLEREREIARLRLRRLLLHITAAAPTSEVNDDQPFQNKTPATTTPRPQVGALVRLHSVPFHCIALQYITLHSITYPRPPTTHHRSRAHFSSQRRPPFPNKTPKKSA